MAIAVRSSSMNTDSAVTTLTVGAPSGTTTGDLVLIIAARNSPALASGIVDDNGSTPFTRQWEGFEGANGHYIAIFTRRIQGGDPSSYTFDFDPGGDLGATRMTVFAMTFSSPHPSSIFNVAPSNGTGSVESPDDGTINATNITSTNAGCIHIITVIREGGTGGFDDTTPSGYTMELFGGASWNVMTVFYKVISSASSTGTIGLTADGSGSALSQSFLMDNGESGFTISAVGGGYTTTGVAATLRTGSFTYLRHRK